MFFQVLHVDVAVVFELVLVRFDGKRPYQTQATGRIVCRLRKLSLGRIASIPAIATVAEFPILRCRNSQENKCRFYRGLLRERSLTAFGLYGHSAQSAGTVVLISAEEVSKLRRRQSQG